MASRSTQLSLALKSSKPKKYRLQHGGEDLAKLKLRKEERPFDPEKALHLTMRASSATGERSMLHPSRSRKVHAIVHRAADRHGVVLERYVCVGNHLHFVLRTKARRMRPAREALAAFLREVSGLVARLVTGAKKGKPTGQRFWDYLAWSRVVGWGKELKTAYRYLEKNLRECIHVLSENNWPSPELSEAPP